METGKISKSQSDYYGKLYEEYSYSPEAVASGKQIYKDLRYEKLSGIFQTEGDFSVHDVGMGLGHYYEYLKEHFKDRKITYSGSEVTEHFYRYCRDNYPECEFHLRDLSEKPCQDRYDYLIYGGTFYHPCDNSRVDWEKFIFSILENGFKMATVGIAFNVITELCDFYERGLYYCDIAKMIHFINDNLSRFFRIDHAYALYELTVYVYREDFIKANYAEEEFAKYFKVP